ncbi:MAG: DsbE family thiol:disulfide interchange protein [Rhizobiales bacterium]|nr:DsbE family thiol:disulfide interchange protein [Hyphomicrobiales bacterium]
MSEPATEAPAGARRLIWTAVPVIVFGALALAMFVGLRSGDPSILPSALVGKPVPEFTLNPLPRLNRDGKPVPGISTADLTGGEVTLVNIWASWCGPCRQEHPLLMQLDQSGIKVVGINYKDQEENARRFLGTLGNPYRAVGVDDDGRSAIDWGVYGVPETFVVDGDGVIRHKHVGPLTAGAVESRLVPAIEAARAEK